MLEKKRTGRIQPRIIDEETACQKPLLTLLNFSWLVRVQVSGIAVIHCYAKSIVVVGPVLVFSAIYEHRLSRAAFIFLSELLVFGTEVARDRTIQHFSSAFPSIRVASSSPTGSSSKMVFCRFLRNLIKPLRRLLP